MVAWTKQECGKSSLKYDRENREMALASVYTWCRKKNPVYESDRIHAICLIHHYNWLGVCYTHSRRLLTFIVFWKFDNEETRIILQCISQIVDTVGARWKFGQIVYSSSDGPASEMMEDRWELVLINFEKYRLTLFSPMILLTRCIIVFEAQKILSVGCVYQIFVFWFTQYYPTFTKCSAVQDSTLLHD